MRWHLVALLSAVAISSTCFGAFGHEGAEAQPATRPIEDVPSLAQWVFAVTDVILQRHIDPPTRQEMIRTGMKSVFVAARHEPPGELSVRVSGITTADELAAFLTELWPSIGKLGNEPDESGEAALADADSGTLERILLMGILQPVSGNPVLMPATEAKVQAQLAANRYVGIGIGLAYDDERSYPKIAGIFPGGPAAKAGAAEGDLIVEIDGVSAVRIELQEALRRLRGDAGSSVTIVVRQPDQKLTRTLHLVRDVVQRQTVLGYRNTGPDQWDCRVDFDAPIAYLSINEIGGSALHELRQYEQRLRAEGMQALILDFRSRDSGDAHYAVALADGLIGGGEIGRIRSRNGVKTYQADADCLFRDWPMAVLVDERTGGVHAWVAAGLQDARHAVLVGRPSVSYEPFIASVIELPGMRDLLRLGTAELKRTRDIDFNKFNEVFAAARSVASIGGVGGALSEEFLPLLPDHVVQEQPQRLRQRRLRALSTPQVNRAEPPDDGAGLDEETTAEATPQPVQEDHVLGKAMQVLRATLSNGGG